MVGLCYTFYDNDSAELPTVMYAYVGKLCFLVNVVNCAVMFADVTIKQVRNCHRQKCGVLLNITYKLGKHTKSLPQILINTSISKLSF